MSQSCPAVAQISNLLYRRIPFGKPPDRSETQESFKVCGLEIRDTAGWKPALQACSPGETDPLRHGNKLRRPADQSSGNTGSAGILAGELRIRPRPHAGR